MSTRRERTTALLQSTALRLFLERGYDETTVAEIAASAGVSHMTFFRHFPTKESVVVGDPYDPLIAEAVQQQPVELPTFERVRRGLLAAWSQMPEMAMGETRDRIRLAVRHPALRAASQESSRATEQIVVAALEDSGVGHLEAIVATGACLGAVMAALVDWGVDPHAGPLGPRVVAALEALPHAPDAHMTDPQAVPPAPSRSHRG
ncbi:MAG TPA: TetR family transcriptional regulator [Cellulomonas sp.]